MENTNFEIVVDVDGNTPYVDTVHANGEANITIYQNDRGSMMKALTIKCKEDEGTITTEAFYGNNLVWKLKTEKEKPNE